VFDICLAAAIFLVSAPLFHDLRAVSVGTSRSENIPE
jgi:hypothetical protein